jgi:translation initiation factor SUI1
MDLLLDFAPATQKLAETGLVGDRTGKIHIRTQQMGKKWLTLVEGLEYDLDLSRIARAIKKDLHCAATVDTNQDGDEYIKLSGNHRAAVAAWLVENEVLTAKEGKARLVLHGA